MDYIYKHPGRIDYPSYQRYLESIRDKLPGHIYSFAADINHFNFESHISLHDAWLETLTVKAVATGKRKEIRDLEINLTLLGPFQDRRILLHYTGVAQYSFAALSQPDRSAHQQSALGDLLTHEIRLGRDGLFIHELLFDHDAHFFVECVDIMHSEEAITTTFD